jgi:hypothetical protein
MHSKLILWLSAAMLRWMHVDTMPNEAAKAVLVAHYRDVAADASEVAFDPAEPPLFSGDLGRMKTASLIVAVAGLEGAYQDKILGDKSQSACMMQIHLPGSSRIALKGDGFAYSVSPADSYSKADLNADRKACLRVGLHILRNSIKTCGKENLSAYTSGHCSPREPKAEYRLSRAMKLFSVASSLPGTDADFLTPSL